MTLSPSPHLAAETVLDAPDHRAAALCRALGCRRSRHHGRQRFFLMPAKVEQFKSLYAAGFHPIRRGSVLMFRRDPKALDLYAALRVARETPAISPVPA